MPNSYSLMKWYNTIEGSLSMMESIRQLEVSVRPIRFAFILGHQSGRKQLFDVIKACCTNMGGIHNIIIPTDGQNIEPYWLPFLHAANPDVVILKGKFNNIKEIKSSITELGIQPFQATSRRGKFENRNVGLPIQKVFTLKRAEVLHDKQDGIFEIVSPLRPSKNTTLFDYFFFGILPKSIMEQFTGQVTFTRPRNMLGERGGTIFKPIELTREYLNYELFEFYTTGDEPSILGPSIIVALDRESLEDCCLYWNWRALSSHSNFVGYIDKDDIHNLFENLDRYLGWTFRDIPESTKLLTSISMGLSTSRSCKKKLSQIPGYEDKVSEVGFSYKHPTEYDRRLAVARYFCAKDTSPMVNGKYGRITRRVPAPYTYRDCSFTDLAVDIDIKPMFQKQKTGILFSPRHKVEDILDIEEKLHDIDTRVGKYNFTFLLPHTLSMDSIGINLRPDWEILCNIFERCGLHICESSSGKHMRKCISLAGSIDDLALYYTNRITRAMLNAFLIPHSEVASTLKGRRREAYRRSYTVRVLPQEVSRILGKVSSRERRHIGHVVNNWIDTWLRKGIMLSGFELSCPECDFETWYPISEVGEKYKCWRCQSENRRPPEAEIHYRLHESMYQAHIENMVVPVLTLQWLKRYMCDHSFIYSVPVSLQGGEPSSPDIDIVAIVDGGIIIGECKKPNKLPIKLFDRYSQVAEKVMADAIVLSTISRNNSCDESDCDRCSKSDDRDYADNAFTHGVPSDSKQWGSREKIKDFRNKQSQKGVSVITLCSHDLGLNI